MATDWKNVYAISVFAFFDAFQFSFFVWTFWPYVQQLDSSMSTSFVGLLMAVSGIGEAVAAPLFGIWTNKCGRILPPLVASVCLSMIGNVVYLCLNGVPLPYRTSALLLSRFLNGAGSGNRGSYFAYIAAASSTEDRTRSMALSGGGALIGLNIGPAVQVLFTWIGPDGFDFGYARISMYTAPAVFAVMINISCIMFLAFTLEDGLERFDSDDVISINTKDTDLESYIRTIPRLDVVAVVVCMLTRAARMLITANVESIGSPFSEIMFDLDKSQVLNYNSGVQAAVGSLTTVMFLLYAFTDYSKWVSERLNCVGAMWSLLIFHLVTFSWPFLPGSLTNCHKYTSNATNYNWSWCNDLAPINMWMYYIGYAVVFGVGLPCLNNSLQSLYSQILGKGRQGAMQGLNQAVGCVSRILGPLFISSAFSLYGPRATWLIEITLLVSCLIVWFAVYHRLRPVIHKEPDFYTSSSVENSSCTGVSTVSGLSCKI